MPKRGITAIMFKVKQGILPLLAIFIFPLFTGCDSSKQTEVVRGTGSETETISAWVLQPGGEPAGNARVSMRLAGFLKETDPLVAMQSTTYRDLKTDAKGMFRIDSVAPGSYLIEVNKEGVQGVLISYKVRPQAADTFLGQIYLKSTGSITGKLLPRAPDGAIYSVQVAGMDRLALPDSAGNYGLRDMPKGTFALRFSSNQNVLGEARQDSVTVYSGRETNLAPVELVQGCADGACDSTVVRSLLDSNGFKSVPLSQVMETDSLTGRIVTLRLSERSLKGSHLRILPGEVQKLKTLRDLDLSSNFLPTIPGEIFSLSNLEVLILSENRLSMVPAALGALGRLKWLDLSQNLLTFLPSGFEMLKALRYLDLDENRLTTLQARLAGLDSLRYLSMVNNEFRTFPLEILSFKGLRHLDVRDNFISSLPAGIWDLPELVHLNVRNNRLRTIPAPMAIQGKLDSLDAGKNDLTSLPAGIIRLEGLIFLSMRGNRLCSVDQEIAGWIGRLEPDWKRTQECP